MNILKLSRDLKAAYGASDVAGRVRRFDSQADEGADAAGQDHAAVVKEYYDLCGEFMVFGWAESLHFAPLSPSESLEESQIRHQRLMIEKLELSPGMSVIDVGCGIGGPMRRVIREAGVKVVGININEIQLEKARALNAEAGVGDMAEFLSCSFMDMSAVEDETFDRGYAIESTCHAPDKVGAFTEIHRVLKPGALLWGQEMCLTDVFDPADDRHQALKRDLMHGIALNDIATTDEVNRDLEAAGFEVIEGIDRAVAGDDPATPWYQPMERRGGTLGNTLRRTPLGRRALGGASRLLEAVRVFPKGSADVIDFMDRTANAYVAGGRSGIFTPLYCFLARKP